MNAKKIIGFSLGVLCLSASAGVVLAQDSAPGVNGPPKVLVIQREYEEKVYEVAIEIAELEDHIVEEALTGTPLREARIKYGYHQLQRSNG